ncbi:CPBP family intramembrane glutamic endopeptidase [Ruminococcus sp. XPD3002]|uniref:CPBP family intramembrane glutamic endopeptidase n=1 Tax=Ruminococcus sp. XPD3002 TaxID=1452269 RepID=UPI000922126F|nr:hypothetical protein SAMN04487832_110111 [Ruminococcus flavefaciens]
MEDNMITTNNSTDLLDETMTETDSAIMLEETSKEFKKNCSRKVGVGLLLYTLVSFAVTAIVALAYIAVQGIQGKLDSLSGDVDPSLEGWSMLIAVILGIIFLFVYSQKFITPKQVLKKQNKITPKAILGATALFLGMSFIYEFMMDGMEALLNLGGYTIQDSIDTANLNMEMSLSLTLYAGIIGPIAEELVYRGFVMKSLERFGKVFSIITSALFFGVMHANPAQIPYCAIGGLILGYIASNYGIIWSMFIHIVNNLIFGVFVEDALDKFFGEKVGEYVEMGMLFVLLVIGGYIVYLNREKIGRFIKNNPAKNKKVYLWTFTTIPVIIFIVFNLILAVTAIEKIK